MRGYIWTLILVLSQWRNRPDKVGFCDFMGYTSRSPKNKEKEKSEQP